MLIGISILPLIVLSLLSLVFGNDFVGIVLDEESMEIEWSELEPITLELDPLIGAIVMIAVIAVAVMILGLRVLASGLSDSSVRIMGVAISYVGIWFFLSVLAMPLIIGIEIFGFVIYISLTLTYTIGVIEKMSGVG